MTTPGITTVQERKSKDTKGKDIIQYFCGIPKDIVELEKLQKGSRIILTVQNTGQVLPVKEYRLHPFRKKEVTGTSP